MRQQRLSSPQQVYKMLWRQPASLYLCSEWGVILQFAKRQPAGSIEQTLTVLSEVWDGTPITMDVDDIKLTDPGVDGQYIIRAPRLTMLAALSHDQLATALKLSEMGRGRWSKSNTGLCRMTSLPRPRLRRSLLDRTRRR